MSHPATPLGHEAGLRLPPGLMVAGTGARIGAWLIDTVILFVIGAALGVFLMAVGAVSENPEAARQLQGAPDVLPSVPLYSVNLMAVAFAEAASLIFTVLYATVFLRRFRGLPGQKLLSLQVGDARTGGNLSLDQAVTRSVLLYGLTAAAGAILSVAAYDLLGTVPISELLGGSTAGPMASWTGGWVVLLLATVLFSIAWPVILLVSVVGDRYKQGLHDRLAGSMVIARAPNLPPLPAGAYVPAPGYWPQAGMPGYPVSPSVSTGPARFAPDADSSASAPPSVLGPSFASDEPAPPESQPGPEPDPSPRPPSGGWSGGNAGLPKEPVWLHDDSYDKPSRRSSTTAGKRVGAYILDSVLVFMMFYLVLEVIAIGGDPAQPFTEKSSIIAGLIGGAEQAFYFVGGWLVWGGSLGQRILHMEVVDTTTRKKLGFQDAFLRWTIMQGPFAAATIAPAGLNVLVVTLAIPWAFYLLYTVMTSPDGRGLHDRFVNSSVTRDF